MFLPYAVQLVFNIGLYRTTVGAIFMIEPVDLDDFFISFFSSAMVILMGALYALLFTFAKRLQRPLLMLAAYLSYCLLTVNVVLLSNALHLNGYWQVIAWVMLGGYLLAPHAIWYLCEGTHRADEIEIGSESPAEKQQTN